MNENGSEKRRDWGKQTRACLSSKEMDTYNYNRIKVTRERIPIPEKTPPRTCSRISKVDELSTGVC